MVLTLKDFQIQNFGECKYDSPLKLSTITGDFLTDYVKDDERVLYHNTVSGIKADLAVDGEMCSFEKAGPRQKIFFNPSTTRAAIVTCGGLCPGINDVIRGIVMQLYFQYKVRKIYGFRYGYYGMIQESGLLPMVLDPESVSEIHKKGGSILGSSRGPQDVGLMVDRLMDYQISILFCIGGDGTLKGAKAITDEINRRKLPISVIGVPKTIDNDIGFIERTFGFETAFSHAVSAINSAHVEAKGYQNTVGLVKLMGRQSGYITANASIASGDVNFCLVPEVPFDLEGEHGFYKHLYDRIVRKSHAVIAVAEGVGETLCATDEVDISGNKKSGDVGLFLKEGIKKYFKDRGMHVGIKYIDPSYIIRSSSAIPSDSVFCTQLAQHAVHAGMAGKTGMIIGLWNNVFTHVPIEIAVKNRKSIDPEGMFWLNVLENTGQPKYMLNKLPESN